MPHRCPACDRALYSTSASRPGLRSTLRARLLFLAAGVVAAAVYAVVLIVLREKLAMRSRLDGENVLVHYPPTLLVSLAARKKSLRRGGIATMSRLWSNAAVERPGTVRVTRLE